MVKPGAENFYMQQEVFQLMMNDPNFDGELQFVATSDNKYYLLFAIAFYKDYYRCMLVELGGVSPTSVLLIFPYPDVNTYSVGVLPYNGGLPFDIYSVNNYFMLGSLYLLPFTLKGFKKSNPEGISIIVFDNEYKNIAIEKPSYPFDISDMIFLGEDVTD